MSLYSEQVSRESVDLSMIVEKGDLRWELKARGAFHRAAEFAVIAMIAGVLVAGVVALCIWARADGMVALVCGVIVGVGVPTAGWRWTSRRR